MSVEKRLETDIFFKNSGLNRSLRVKNRKKRVYDQVHVGLQDRLEKEMKIRDGATRLINACTHETQLLEAAKTLHTSNARTLAYLAQLQRLKAAEVVEAVMDDPGFGDESRVCKGRIAISDIRIPLVWKEIFTNNKSKENNKHAVFCLVTVGSEVQDSELVCVDKASTDISFNDVIVFERSPYDFKLVLEVFACPMSNHSISADTPQKLLSRLNRSLGKIEGRRMKEHMKENVANGINNAIPYYEKIASTTLTLADLSDAIRSHDLNRTSSNRRSLPLYESVTCRLVAQPQCLTDVTSSGFLHMLEMIGSAPNWSYLWCEVKAGILKGWKNPEDSNKKPHFVVDLLPANVKINEIEKSRQKRAHSFQVRNLTERHLFAARDSDDLIKWIRSLRQHKTDHGAWGTPCVSSPCDRTPMFIASPSPQNVSSDLMFEHGVRKTLIYEQLGIDSPVRPMTQTTPPTDLLDGSCPKSEHLATQSIRSILLEKQTTAPWAGFFTGAGSKPAKVTRMSAVQRRKSSEEVAGRPPNNHLPSSITDTNRLGSDTTSDSDAKIFPSTQQASSLKLPSLVKEGVKKKRRAPMSPWDKTSGSPLGSPPPKPPLPELPLKEKMKLRCGLFSASPLEDKLKGVKDDSRSRVRAAHLQLQDSDQMISHSHRSSRSSGYNSENESGGQKPNERVWANQRNHVIPLGGVVSPLPFERSKSLDTHEITLKSSPSVPQNEARPRTNSIPERSPSKTAQKSLSLDVAQSERAIKNSNLNATEASTVSDDAASEGSSFQSYRRLHYNANAQVYCQAKPPPLPPKLKVFKKAASFPVVKEEPIYAKIDKTKKNRDIHV